MKVKDLEIELQKNLELIERIQIQNEKFTALIEKINATKPKREDFQHEAAYSAALQQWSQDFE